MLVKLSFINKVIHIKNNTFSEYKGKINLTQLTDDEFQDVCFYLLNQYHNRGIETENKVVIHYAKKAMGAIDTYIKEVRTLMRKAKRTDVPKRGNAFVNFGDNDYIYFLSLLKMIKRDISHALNGDPDVIQDACMVQQFDIPKPRQSKKG